MPITAISVLRRDPSLANSSGLIAGSTGPDGKPGANGPAGQTGSAGPSGRGISSVATNSNSHLIPSNPIL